MAFAALLGSRKGLQAETDAAADPLDELKQLTCIDSWRKQAAEGIKKKSTGDNMAKEKLIAARQRYAEHFPVTTKQWGEWIEEDASLDLLSADTQTSAAARLLCTARVGHPLAVQVWLSLVDSLAERGVPLQLALLDEAIEFEGKSFQFGSLLYFRKIELLEALLDVVAEATDVELADQEQRIRAVYRELLGTPHAQWADSRRRYEEWDIEPSIPFKTPPQLDTMRKFEEQVTGAGTKAVTDDPNGGSHKQLAAWNRYFEWVKEHHPLALYVALRCLWEASSANDVENGNEKQKQVKFAAYHLMELGETVLQKPTADDQDQLMWKSIRQALRCFVLKDEGLLRGWTAILCHCAAAHERNSLLPTVLEEIATLARLVLTHRQKQHDRSAVLSISFLLYLGLCLSNVGYHAGLPSANAKPMQELADEILAFLMSGSEHLSASAELLLSVRQQSVLSGKDYAMTAAQHDVNHLVDWMGRSQSVDQLEHIHRASAQLLFCLQKTRVDITRFREKLADTYRGQLKKLQTEQEASALEEGRRVGSKTARREELTETAGSSTQQHHSEDVHGNEGRRQRIEEVPRNESLTVFIPKVPSAILAIEGPVELTKEAALKKWFAAEERSVETKSVELLPTKKNPQVFFAFVELATQQDYVKALERGSSRNAPMKMFPFVKKADRVPVAAEEREGAAPARTGTSHTMRGRRVPGEDRRLTGSAATSKPKGKDFFASLLQ